MTLCPPDRTQSLPPAASLEPAQIASGSGSNFLAGFICLDAERRRGMTAIYAFCRVADDAVDEAPDAATGAQHLAFWRQELAAAAEFRAGAGHGTTAASASVRPATAGSSPAAASNAAGTGGASDVRTVGMSGSPAAATCSATALAPSHHTTPRTPVGKAIAAAMQRFGVPAAPLHDLLDGVATDLEPRPFADDAELHRYCYRVAAAVGLACLPVLGADSPAAQRFADSLGHALQLTNILRDLRGDAVAGRCYVPSTWLAAASVHRDWLRGDGPDAAYAANGPIAQLSARLAMAARQRFAEADAALRSLPRRERRALVPARIMGAVYRSLLTRLEARGGELRGERVRVPKLQKLACVFGVLLGVKA